MSPLLQQKLNTLHVHVYAGAGLHIKKGRLHGMVSSHHHSWSLKSDGKGNLWVSDAVGAESCGDARHVFVTQVRQLHMKMNLCRILRYM